MQSPNNFARSELSRKRISGIKNETWRSDGRVEDDGRRVHLDSVLLIGKKRSSQGAHYRGLWYPKLVALLNGDKSVCKYTRAFLFLGCLSYRWWVHWGEIRVEIRRSNWESAKRIPTPSERRSGQNESPSTTNSVHRVVPQAAMIMNN